MMQASSCNPAGVTGPEARAEQQRRVLAFLLHEAPGASSLLAGAKQAALHAGLDLLRSDLLGQEAMDFANVDLWGPCIVRSALSGQEAAWIMARAEVPCSWPAACKSRAGNHSAIYL